MTSRIIPSWDGLPDKPLWTGTIAGDVAGLQSAVQSLNASVAAIQQNAVPYSGALWDVNLGTRSLAASSVTSSGNISAGGVVHASAGSPASPSIRLGDSSTGIFRPAANQFGISCGGVTYGVFSGNGFTVENGNFRVRAGGFYVNSQNGDSFGAVNIGNTLRFLSWDQFQFSLQNNAFTPMSVTTGGVNVTNLTTSGDVLFRRVSDNAEIARIDNAARRFTAGADSLSVDSASGNVRLWNSALIGWTNQIVASSGSLDLTLSRASANTLQIGTSAANALGSLNLNNLTVGGNINMPTGNAGAAISANSGGLVLDANTGSGKTVMIGSGQFRAVLGSSGFFTFVPLVANARTSAEVALVANGAAGATGNLIEAKVNNGPNVFVVDPSGNINGQGNLHARPAALVTPSVTNGSLTFEATSNTSFTIKYRGSDGVVRSAVLPLS